MSLGSGDAAEEVVRLALSGADITLRLVASATKNLAALMVGLGKKHKKLSGKTKMHKMLRETRDIQIVTMTPKEYKAFKRRAGKYKILYATVKDKKDKSKAVDVLMPLTEMSRASLLLQRIGIHDQITQPQQKVREEQVKNANRSGPSSRDTKNRQPSSGRQSTSPKSPQTMANQKPSVEAKLEGYRQQQSATREPTETQRKRRRAKTSLLR